MACKQCDFLLCVTFVWEVRPVNSLLGMLSQQKKTRAASSVMLQMEVGETFGRQGGFRIWTSANWMAMFTDSNL